MRITAFVLLTALLTSCSENVEPEPEARGVVPKPTPAAEATIEQIQDLMRKRDDQALVRILCETSDWDVTQEILSYFKAPMNGGNMDVLQKSEAEIIRRHGKYPVADVYICRGEKNGLSLMGEAFREFETAQDTNEDYWKLVSMVRGYLLVATGIRFETAESYVRWLEKNMADITIEQSSPPRIKVEPKEGTQGKRSEAAYPGVELTPGTVGFTRTPAPVRPPVVV